MMNNVSKRLNFDDQIPKLLTHNQVLVEQYQRLSQMDRKRRKEDDDRLEYRKRRHSICSESDCSLDRFDSDENHEEDVEDNAAKHIFHEVHLPNKQVSLIPSRRNSSHTNINPFSPKNSKRIKRENSPIVLSDTPVKRKRPSLSKMSIKRYESEFLEIEQLASGSFGQVMLARHRLDGVDYAVKISKKHIRDGSNEEKKALNEVFAHATLNSHKHVVRYYNSWVEDGQLYIQNEFCQGGSLNTKIEEKRVSGQNFSEDELKRILKHVLKGLQYIHSNDLAHLDIKPENIFISIEDSDEHENGMEEFHYKIGDLGHIISVGGEVLSTEEGDCRYMAPEFLKSNMNNNILMKADIFSLGLTLYEAASLKYLPRNRAENPSYQKIKKGNLEYLENYSPQFNSVIQSMVHPKPDMRPSTIRLLEYSFLGSPLNLSKSQLCSELSRTKGKIERLQLELGDEKDSNLRREQ